MSGREVGRIGWVIPVLCAPPRAKRSTREALLQRARGAHSPCPSFASLGPVTFLAPLYRARRVSMLFHWGSAVPSREGWRAGGGGAATTVALEGID